METSAVLADEPTVRVEVRIDADLKRRADELLASRGLTVSDALTMMLESTMLDGEIPRYWLGPNADTREAIAELDRGEGKTFQSVEELIADLYEND